MAEEKLEPTWKDLRFQIFAAICAAFNYMPVGIGFAFSSILLPPGLLGDERHVFRNHTTYTVHNASNFTIPDSEVHFANHTDYRGHHDQTKYLQVNATEASWIASLLSLFSVVGAMVSGQLMDRLGRKMSLQITAALNLCGWALTVASAYCLPLVYAARILNGLAEGLCSTCFVYMAEVSHPRVRTSFLAAISASIAVGIALTSLLGYLLYWPGVAMFATALTFLTLVALSALPETPHWILRHVEDPEEREKRLCDSLQWIYRNPKIYEHQLNRLKRISLWGRKDPTNEEPKTPPRIKKILILLLLIMLLQVLTGAYLVIFFAFQLFEAAGSTGSTSWLLMNLLGVARILAAFCSTLQLVNRRPLLISSAIGMTACMYTSAILIKVYSPCLTAAIFVLLHVCFSTYGVLVIPAGLVGELLPNKYRARYSGFIFAYGYFLNFITVKNFILLEDVVGTAYIFIGLGTFSAVTAVFAYFTIPETRKVPLEVLQEQLNKKRGLRL